MPLTHQSKKRSLISPSPFLQCSRPRSQISDEIVVVSCVGGDRRLEDSGGFCCCTRSGSGETLACKLLSSLIFMRFKSFGITYTILPVSDKRHIHVYQIALRGKCHGAFIDRNAASQIHKPLNTSIWQ